MPVDLEALAKKYGGSVAPAATNLDEMAVKHGGKAQLVEEPQPIEEPPKQDEKSISGFASNVLKSGGQLVGDVVNAAVHLPSTLKAVGELGLGAAEKIIPGEQGHEKNVDALVNSYVERYGGLDKLKETMYSDPVGVLADVATLATGAGAVAKGVQVTSKVAGLSRVAAGAGKVANVAGAVEGATNPMRLAGKAAKGAVKVAANKVGLPTSAGGLYGSALKPSTTLPLEKRAKVIQAGLEFDIPVSEAGLGKLTGLIDDLNTKIQARVDAGKAAGVTIDPQRVVTRVGDVYDTFKNQVSPNADLAAIKQTASEFLKNNQSRMPADEAQRIKQGTYRQLKSKAYGELKGAEIETQKALARGIKEELAQAFPELKDLNATESRALGLEKHLERAVGRIGNHQLMGIGTPLAAAGAGAVTGSTTAAGVIGAIKFVVDNPEFKSKLAIAINKVRARKPNVAERVVRAATGSRALTGLSRVSQYSRELEEGMAGLAEFSR